MMMTHILLALVLAAAAPAGSLLPPEADAHNKRAMAFYDQGRLVDALVAFRAAYDAMPDVRRDRVGRDQILDSMHFTLVRLHELDGGPRPLCQLERLVQEHIAALDAAFPELPEVGTIKYEGTVARLRGRLAAFPPDVCAREKAAPIAPAPVTAASEGPAATADPGPTVTEAPAAAAGPTKLAADAPPPVVRSDRRRVRAGVGTLVPGLLLFAPTATLLAYRADGRRELVGINADTKMREATEAETARAFALNNRHIATTAGAAALGITGAALVVTGAVLLATGKRMNHVVVAPWGGRLGGLVVQGRF